MTRPVSKLDTIEMAQASIREIKQLRAINAELAPKAEAYDLLRTVLNLFPQRSQGMSEDIVWKLERRVEELNDETEVS